MKKIFLITILVISLIVIVGGIMYIDFENNRYTNAKEITSESKVIKYNKNIYQIIPSEYIEEYKDYADILDDLELDYKVDIDDIGVKLKDLEEGGSIYMTKYQDDRVFIVRDYNEEYLYAFKLQ